MATRKRKTTAKTTAKKEEVKKERKEQVKAVDFVPVWQGASTAAEVNEHFGREAADTWAGAFASRLRKLDVPMKKMKRGGSGSRIDVDELTALANESLVEE